jgi:hypothetical protein
MTVKPIIHHRPNRPAFDHGEIAAKVNGKVIDEVTGSAQLFTEAPFTAPSLSPRVAKTKRMAVINFSYLPNIIANSGV